MLGGGARVQSNLFFSVSTEHQSWQKVQKSERASAVDLEQSLVFGQIPTSLNQGKSGGTWPLPGSPNLTYY